MVLKGEPTSNRACKVKLKVTEEQKNFMLLNMRISKTIFNWARRYNLKEFEAIEEDKKEKRKEFNALPEAKFTELIEAWANKEYTVKEGNKKKKVKKNLSKYNSLKEEHKDNPEKLKKIFVNILADQWGYDQEKGRISLPGTISNVATTLKKDKESFLHWTNAGDSYAFFYTIGLDYKNAVERYVKGKTKAFKRIAKKRKEEAQNPKKKPREYKYPRDFGFPRYREEADSYPCVIPRHWLDYENKKVRLPKMPKGQEWVKIWPNQELPKFDFPSKDLGNPRVTTDGVDFYLSFAYYAPVEPYTTKQEEVMGIDLGLKNVMICSDGEIVRNIADDKKVKKLEEKIKKLQRKICRLREGASSNCRIKTRKKRVNRTGKVVKVYSKEQLKERWKRSSIKLRKLALQLKKAQIKMNNYKKGIKENIAHDLVAKNPAGIVFENLNIQDGMQKNKKLSPRLQKTGMYSMKLTVVKHASKHGIKCQQVDTFFPSSQTCSVCGAINPDMKDIGKRVYICPKCRAELDRDLNASYNLKKAWNTNVARDIN